MGWLAPAFLAGLAAIAVPLIVHLTQRSKSRVTAYPSLMFLRRVPFRSTRKRRLRHPLLLALRILAIGALAAAFARPFLRTVVADPAAGGDAREVVLLIDRSYSMAYGDRWERAIEAAHAAVDELRPQDRASLVWFDERAEAVVRSGAEPASLRASLADVRPGFGVTRYDPAFRLAARILAESEAPRRDVALISDFQRTGWPEASGAQFPVRTRLIPVDLSDPDPANRAVTDLTFRREPSAGLDRVTAAARVSNLGAAPAPGVEVTLTLGGKAVGTRRLDLGVRESATVSFPGLPVPDAATAGEVRLSPDALPVDDARRFVLASSQVLRVVLVQGSGGDRDRGVFLRRALSIGERPPLAVERRRPGTLAPEDLSRADLLILDDVPFPGGQLGGAIRDRIAAGGGLLVVAGSRNDPSGWSAGTDLLPGTPGPLVDRSGAGGAVLAYLDYDHPIFELFSAPRSGDYSRARFLRYRRFEPAAEAHVLARFEDGGVAMAEGRFGSGRVLVWTSTLDRFWNDLALQPVYLPFVQQVARYAGGYEESRRWYEVGQVIDASEAAGGAGTGDQAAGEAPGPGTEWVLVAPSGARQLVEPESGTALVPLREAGFYELRPREGDGASLTLAVNPRLEESDLSTLDPAELASATLAALEGEEVGGENAEEADAGIAEAAPVEARQELWWFLMLAAGLVLAIETALSNRLSTRPRPTRPRAAPAP